jgi:hypothetical protein
MPRLEGNHLVPRADLPCLTAFQRALFTNGRVRALSAALEAERPSLLAYLRKLSHTELMLGRAPS